ncbi:MAG: HAMP domain-containing methyl-accepting chemotaxis protein [Candidatus Margulisiibacteriota bacterium]
MINWFINLKIGQKLGVGFLIVFLLIGAIGYIGWKGIEDARNVSDQLTEDIVPGGIAMVEMESAAHLLSHSIMGYITRNAWGDEAQGAMKLLVKAGAAHTKHAAHLGEEEKKEAEELALKIRKVNSIASEILRSKDEGAGNEKLIQKDRKEFHPALQVLLKQLRKHKDTHMQEISAAAEAVNLIHHRTQRSIVISTLIALFLILIVRFFIVRSLLRPIMRIKKSAAELAQGNLNTEVEIDTMDELGELAGIYNLTVGDLGGLIKKIKDAGLQITSFVSQIRSAAEEQASGAAEQSSAVSETSSTINELAATAAQIAQNSQNVIKASEKTLAGMNEINSKVGDTAKKILSLGEKSQTIGTITKIIDDLADQTNLLALNAAVEAARAGDAGRGFAVVASEVRKLAERSTESTGEIRQLISEIQAETNSAIMGVEDATKWVAKGLELVQESTQKAKEIGLATQQQKSAAQQVVGAMKSVDEVTKQFVASTKEAAASTDQLDRLARELKQSVEQFKLEN